MLMHARARGLFIYIVTLTLNVTSIIDSNIVFRGATEDRKRHDTNGYFYSLWFLSLSRYFLFGLGNLEQELQYTIQIIHLPNT